MCSVIKQEFRLRNLGLSFDKPECFTCPQWRWPRPLYLIYRFLLAGYTLSAYLYIMVWSERHVNTDHDDNNDNTSNNVTGTPDIRRYHAMVYLTIWTYLLETCHFILAFIISVASCTRNVEFKEPRLTSIKTGSSCVNSAFSNDQGLVDDKQKSVSFDRNANDLKIHDCSNGFNDSDVKQVNSKNVTLPWYSKLDWLLVNFVSVFAIVVTAIFFGALYRPKDGGLPFNDVNVHALNTVFIIVDNFVSARPTRILHFIYPIIYGSCYVIFSAIFWSVDHTNVVYKVVLDWNNPQITVGVVAGIIVLIILLQCVNFALCRFRIMIHRKLNR